MCRTPVECTCRGQGEDWHNTFRDRVGGGGAYNPPPLRADKVKTRSQNQIYGLYTCDIDTLLFCMVSLSLTFFLQLYRKYYVFGLLMSK